MVYAARAVLIRAIRRMVLLNEAIIIALQANSRLERRNTVGLICVQPDRFCAEWIEEGKQ